MNHRTRRRSNCSYFSTKVRDIKRAPCTLFGCITFAQHFMSSSPVSIKLIDCSRFQPINIVIACICSSNNPIKRGGILLTEQINVAEMQPSECSDKCWIFLSNNDGSFRGVVFRDHHEQVRGICSIFCAA